MYSLSNIEWATRIHCKTKDEAVRLLARLDELGYRWSSEESLLSHTDYGFYARNTYYYIGSHKLISHGSIEWGYDYIEFDELSDFHDDGEDIIAEEPYGLTDLFE